MSLSNKADGSMLLSKSPGPELAARVDLFQILGTENCLLDCSAWKEWQKSIHGTRPSTRDAKREKRQALSELKKAAGAHRGKGAVDRKPFRLDSLESSAKAGCGFCEFILELLYVYFQARTGFTDVSTIEMKWTSYAFNLELRDINGNIAPVGLELFHVNMEGNTPVTGMVTSNYLRGNSSANFPLDWVRNWIEECAASHVLCGTARDVDLPTRLLHLHPLNLNGEEGVRLVVTTGQVGTYACLSHCWGKDPMPITTLESNLAQHLDFVPWDSLPPTFQDAATITKALGLEYLWIDSLCIIQDSRSDWEVESARMATVYGSAFITIAAVSSADFRGGCFSKAHDGVGDICHRIRREEKDLSIVIGLRDGLAVLNSSNISEEFPLLSRAWVYQERMLSRRLLYCTRRELQLLCRTSKGCECGGSSAIHAAEASPQYPTDKNKREYAKYMVDKINPGQGRFRGLNAAMRWHRIVSEYSKLQLSNESDKLPALSGCAKDIARLTGNIGDGEYLAGLWHHTLARDLLWEIHPQAHSSRPAKWRAPSWSWASVDVTNGLSFVEILLSDQLGDFAKRVIEVTCQPKGKDPTGTVASASLRLKTKLYQLPLRRLCYNDMKARKRGTVKHLIESQDLTISADDLQITNRCRFDECGPPLLNGSIRITLNADFRYSLDTFDWIRSKPHGCCQARIFLMHVCDGEDKRAGKDGVDYFLALRRCAATGDVYERVGLVRVIGEQEVRCRWMVEVLDRDFGTPIQEVLIM